MTDLGIYRSAEARDAVRAWCERRVSAWPVRHTRLEVPTALGPTAVLRAGEGPGRPVLLLPGTNFGIATSLGPVDALVRSREVILVDLPGQPGLSHPVRPAGDHVRAYGRWVDELLGVLELEGALVVGHSLGAAVALAATPGPRIGGLLLLSPAGLSRARMSLGLVPATLPWMLAPNTERSRALVRFMSGRGLDRTDEDELAEWMTLVARSAKTSLAPPPLGADQLRRWSGVPVVVATGERDVFFPASRLRGPAEALLGRDVEHLEGLGHLAPHEDPAILPRLVARLEENG